MEDLNELPDALQAANEPVRPKAPAMSPEQRAERLRALGVIIAGKREEAVRARRESGIEDVWQASEEAYVGIDDANRSEFGRARWAKPMTMSGPVTSQVAQQSGNKSTAYVRLTTRYVDMGTAKVCEAALPIDDKAFSFEPTPVPDLVAQRDDPTPIRMADGSMVWRAARDDEMARMIQGNPAAAFMGAEDGMQPQVPVTKGDVAKARMQQAKDAAKKAETRIYDWMVEARYPFQMRKVIHDAARIGVGILKGPFPEERTKRAYSVKDGVGTLEILHKVAPSCKWIDPWNFFPHGACGEDIHSGDYVFERDYLSESSLKGLKRLRDAAGHAIYIPGQIDKVIAEGPEKCNVEEGQGPNAPIDKSRYTIWYFTGTLTREDMVTLGAPGADELPDSVVECHAMVAMVNDTPIRATFNPLEKTGHFPYRTFIWSRRAGHWAGVGIGEQVTLPQKMVNAGTRAWLNNAGISSGLQIFIDQNKLMPADGSWEITPNKLWHITADGAGEDVNKLFGYIEIPNRGEELMAIINYAFKLAEDQSNIPLITQGQVGPNDPQTFGQAEMYNNNAHTLLRQQAANLDDSITEPLVGDFYEWLLLDEDVPQDEKGDFDINAQGSTAMVEKAIQEFTMLQMLPLTLNPAWGQDPKKMFAQFMRAKRMDPDATAYTAEELAQMAQRPPPKAPAVEAAEIRAASAEKIAQGRDQTTLQRAAMDADRDTIYANAENERARTAAQAAENKRVQDYEIALLKFAQERQLSIEDAKVQLTSEAMKLRTQLRLASVKTDAPQVATPAIEPAGRAPDGQAFQR